MGEQSSYSFKHLVHIDGRSGELIIDRVFESGKVVLYTKFDLKELDFKNDRAGYEKFCKMLGENILLDSKAAREVLGL